jgi:ubiquitin thioesterase protein OTUB1
MGEESDHVHITALSDALGVPVRVVYLDQSGDINEKPVSVNNHDFIPEGMDSAVDPYVILLYRPGHYDILYRKEKPAGNTVLEQTEQ